MFFCFWCRQFTAGAMILADLVVVLARSWFAAVKKFFVLYFVRFLCPTVM